MSLINVNGLTFGYEGSFDNIFENVSFRIDTDWRLGFVGRNGRGKTTFLRLLSGELPYKGSITASVDFEYFPYPVRDEDELARDCIEEIIPNVEEWRILRELSLLRVDEGVLWRPFNTLSNGERSKLLLAALFLKENSFLLIDEPTNHLDAEARHTVAEYLRGKSGFILVSHDRDFLDACTDHTLSINKTNIEVVKGSYSVWYEAKSRQDEFERAQNEKLRGEIGRLSEAAQRSESWSNKAESRKIGFDPSKVEKSLTRRPNEAAKAKKAMKRAKAFESRMNSAAEEKSKLLKNIEKTEELKLSPLRYRGGVLAALNAVSIRYGDNTVCENVTFDIRNGERVCLSGKNGSGKSSILKLILGEGIEYSGLFTKGSGLIVSYVPQDVSKLSGSLESIAEEAGIDKTLFLTILRKLDFSREMFEKDAGDYSDGQKKKTALARSLATSAHLYIWDEPLNFIDLFSRVQLENLISQYCPTMIFVEHDGAFSRKTATKFISLD